MRYHALADSELRHRQPPFQGGRAQQRRPRGSRRRAENCPGVGDAAGATGCVDTQLTRQLAGQPLPGLDLERALLRLQRMERQAGHQHRDVAEDGVGAGLLYMNTRQRQVQFLGHQHAQRGMDTLPHLAARHGQHHRAIRQYLDPAIEGDFSLDRRPDPPGTRAGARRHQAPADDQCARGSGSTEQPGAP